MGQWLRSRQSTGGQEGYISFQKHRKKRLNFLVAGLRGAVPSIAGVCDTQPHPAPAVPGSIKSSVKMKN